MNIFFILIQFTKYFDMSLPLSFLLAILDPNCNALLGRIHTSLKPSDSANNLSINLSPRPGPRFSAGKHLKIKKLNTNEGNMDAG